MYKVSVIMPVYNAEKYLKNTLNSVINQTIGFENIELILVDDKSTDNSRNIIKEYSNNYPNIKAIFLDENSGCAGIPRNIGIKNATSDYIMFIDDDDEYFPEICDKLYGVMISENADIVVCDYLCTSDQGDVKCSHGSDEVVLGNEIIYFFNNGYIWHCIFKKSVILDNNILFPDLSVCEDLIFSLKYCAHSEKLVYLNDFIGYHYLIRKDSLSYNSVEVNVGVIKSYYVKFEFLEDHDIEYDLNRIFKNDIQSGIMLAFVLKNKDEIKRTLSLLHDFEMKINFTGRLSTFFQFINFFILHGNLNIATYICFLISKFTKSNLLLKIYREYFKDG